MKAPNEIDNLKNLTQPLIKWLETNGSPYTEITISKDAIRVMDLSICIPIQEKAIADCKTDNSRIVVTPCYKDGLYQALKAQNQGMGNS